MIYILYQQSFIQAIFSKSILTRLLLTEEFLVFIIVMYRAWMRTQSKQYCVLRLLQS